MIYFGACVFYYSLHLLACKTRILQISSILLFKCLTIKNKSQNNKVFKINLHEAKVSSPSKTAFTASTGSKQSTWTQLSLSSNSQPVKQ